MASLINILLIDQMKEIFDDPLQLLQADRSVVIYVKDPAIKRRKCDFMRSFKEPYINKVACLIHAQLINHNAILLMKEIYFHSFLYKEIYFADL